MTYRRRPCVRRSRPRVLVSAAAATALVVVSLSAGATSTQAASSPQPGTYNGKGFDACAAPTQATMSAWRAASPYGAVGIYVGGVNRFCSQPQLTSSWVSTQVAAGWHLMPIYLGLQPQCTTSSKKFRFTPANAAASGKSAADDAIGAAQQLGIPRGSTLFNDIEAYRTDDATCRTSVLTFQSAWTARLHDLGYLSGFYSSLGSGVADQVAVYGSSTYVRPDYLWFARYDGHDSVLDPAIPSSYWVHRRIHQYQNPSPPGHQESYGGKSLEVDRNRLDVTPLPTTPFGDFNGNGWSDVVVRERSAGTLYRFPGNGTRLGSRSQLGTGFAAMDAITRLGDFDRDGREDVIAREKATGALWLYPGSGTSLRPRVRIGAGGWNSMREITAVGDVDEDGFKDVVAVQTSSGCLYLYPGRGNGFAARRLVGCGWNAMSELVGLGDFDGAGHVDLAARRTATGELWLCPGTGSTLRAGPRIGNSGWNGLRDLVGVGDFDRDGRTDLMAVKASTGELFKYLGKGTVLSAGVAIGSRWADLRLLA